ncbi:MAG: flagellar biosynthetic protein FliP, partial [Pseudomonadota bacterium]
MKLAAAFLILLFLGADASAQTVDLGNIINQEQETYTGRIVQGLVLLTVLSLAPALLITTTCFTRFIIAFSFLRSGLGLQSTPSNLILISLALFMTYFVMSPVFNQAWTTGVQPFLDK